jgi:D-glycero-D-manno-heptose 1,7-bisphosphate phosphatase
MYSINWSNKKSDNTVSDKKESAIRYSTDKTEEEYNIPFYDTVNNIAPKVVVGLDRDGVINVDRGDYTYKVDDFEPIEGSLKAIAKIRRLGHKIVIITNQGGISKGIYTQNDVDTVHNHMFNLLGEAGCASIDALYYSETSARWDQYAKPNTGMFKRCEKEFPFIKFSKGFYVGDKISDLKAAFKIGAKPVLVKTGYGNETLKELNKFSNQKIKKKTIVFDNLSSFADWLSRR